MAQRAIRYHEGVMGWTTISSGLFALGKYVTSSLLLGMYNNFAAMANGDTGAPKINGAAIQRISTGLPVLSVTAADTYTVGYGASTSSGTLINTSTTDVVAYTVNISHFTGSMRFTIRHLISSGGNGIVSLYRNGSFVSSVTITSSTAVFSVIDSTVAVSDVIEIRHRASLGGSTSQITSLAKTASDAYEQITPLIQSSLV